MSNLSVSSAPGLTVTIQLYVGSTPFGSPISLTEIAILTGVYVGSMPGGVPYGQYMAIAYGGPNVVLGSNELYWDGQNEIPIGLMTIGGFDPNNNAVNTPNSRQAGPYNLEVDGYGTNQTTVKRIS